ncbi:MAG: septation protein A [Hydrogenovibrio sp.]|uniref:septation protein A n=1 Tax=Hydrogenovibrio sp. TaxID=2065821 RepID=UPI00287099C4|nr:septation protein A [Hydrogenovibrio sp.]MDR9497679.1 septation protein A [Hydrogenovibrio sp.]
MKLLFDLFPVILFFIAFKMYGIYVATAVAIVASIAQVAFVYAKNRKVEKMHLITLALIVILGGATLIFQDEDFIKWKPTVVNWGFALVFVASHFIGKKPIIERMMDQAITLPKQAWLRLSQMWVAFFVFSGVANIYVAYQYSTDTWVNFKLFGLMGLTFAFIVLQGLYIARYVKQDEREQAESDVLDRSMETLGDAEFDSGAVHQNNSDSGTSADAKR